MSFLAKKKLEKIFNIENAGTPKEKNVKAIAVLVTLSLSKDPYPNNDEIICSDAKYKAKAAGTDKNKQSSKALFCKSKALSKLLFLIFLDNSGSITVPTAIPATARLI